MYLYLLPLLHRENFPSSSIPDTIILPFLLMFNVLGLLLVGDLYKTLLMLKIKFIFFTFQKLSLTLLKTLHTPL